MKILIAEDDPSFRHFLEEILATWGYEVAVARDGNEALQILQSENAPKLAILDWKMPGMEGIEVCRTIREVAEEPYTYIILLTSQQRDEDLVIGMEAGADDYILKPFKLNELRVRLRAGRRIIELQDELLAAREILRAKATHDSLTGLLNHEEILDILDRELARSERDGHCVSIIMVDIDHFKKVNDTHGHLAGDAVLRITAQKMHAIERVYDAVGRYGGEEFLLILPECCQECAITIAERLRVWISSESMDTPEGIIPVTISLGVATSSRDGIRDGRCLIKAADTALYKAKENGRNRVELASNEP
ncbi:MAG: diguanylate cyclase response regulator [Geobacteraceae bacterium GWC2_53_11]|nr:MAG: diguanylate cyclase response regulator [Geobacteraceae bacterium GWC2_53_11]